MFKKEMSMTRPNEPNPHSEIPHDFSPDTVMSADHVNPATYDPEREWGKHQPDRNGFRLDFPGAVPPAYFPGYPGWPFDN